MPKTMWSHRKPNPDKPARLKKLCDPDANSTTVHPPLDSLVTRADRSTTTRNYIETR